MNESKFENLKLAEVDALSDFCDLIGEVMKGMDEYRVYLNKNDVRRFNKTYKNLGYFWESIQDRLMNIWDADNREKFIK